MAKTDVKFDAEGTTLRGWLYLPYQRQQRCPIVVMAHGWGAVKEMYLDTYAEAFAEAGLATLVYDHRNFGASDGLPRQEIDPWMQVRDYRHAITYAATLAEVDASRVGIWGTSYSGAHVLVVGAVDRRVRCVVSQCPTISGWRNTLRRYPADGLAEMRVRFDIDRRARFAGQSPAMVPIVSDLASNEHRANDSIEAVGNTGTEWFAHMRQDRLVAWRNELTLRSIELYSEYEPGLYIERVGPTPLLVITGDRDTLTPTDEILSAYARALEPKQLVIVPGGHYDLYGAQRAKATNAACDWLVKHLLN